MEFRSRFRSRSGFCLLRFSYSDRGLVLSYLGVSSSCGTLKGGPRGRWCMVDRCMVLLELVARRHRDVAGCVVAPASGSCL